ncbi:MAG: hypothetical protein ABSH08_01315 [Tepidisphaeraceae bacterium]|jgi:hypothetical protein
MPYTPMQMLCGLVLPAALVGLGAALAWRLFADARRVFGPLVAVAFAIAYWNLEPKIGWPPNGNVLYLLFYFALAAGVLAKADALFRPPWWLRMVVLVILWRIAVRLLLIRQVPTSISASGMEMWIDVSTLVTLIWWLAFEGLAERCPGVTVPLLLGATAGESAIVLTLGWHIMSSGALAGALAIICIAGAVLGACSSRISFSRGFAQTVVLILQLILVHGYFYTDDELTGRQQVWIALLLGSPLLAFIGEIAVLRRQRPAWRLAARLAPALIVLAAVCAATVRDYLHAEQAGPAMQGESRAVGGLPNPSV